MFRNHEIYVDETYSVGNKKINVFKSFCSVSYDQTT